MVLDSKEHRKLWGNWSFELTPIKHPTFKVPYQCMIGVILNNKKRHRRNIVTNLSPTESTAITEARKAISSLVFFHLQCSGIPADPAEILLSLEKFVKIKMVEGHDSCPYCDDVVEVEGVFTRLDNTEPAVRLIAAAEEMVKLKDMSTKERTSYYIQNQERIVAAQ